MYHNQLIEAADRCVLCALCSNHCPTYKLSREEGESPRGRVMLAAALLKGEIKVTKKLEQNFSHCLLCRACESVCPSEVPYSEIIDGVRDRLPIPPLSSRLLEWLALHPKFILQIIAIANLWKRLKLPLPLLAKAALRHNIARQDQYKTAAIVTKKRGKVGLFLGCIASPLDKRTHQDAEILLTKLGFEVVIPKQQHCCGAISQHHGNSNRVKELNSKNRIAFNKENLDAIIFTSSGCGTQLIEHGWEAAPSIEICNFLLNQSEIHKIPLKPLAAKISLHHPCSLTNVLKGSAAVESLIRLIPEIKLSPLGSNSDCCGAGGTHTLREPQRADAIRKPKIDSLLESNASILLSTNFGCALHLTEGIYRAQLKKGEDAVNIEVMHPVSLIVQQLQ
ncbi:MAG: (Fe-S)-binding protein [Thiotrichales bacterium]|jgi:glycolate oxidase iron-sulfur subunit|nr:(Fe-S)-binding protein [Thiotrichales bacterium]MBT3614212.1 (Fe-S)-binding protein [Thiotrichales bacterium]MBT3752030.1 (Fe-S)-binding protein [Thiotrichales bacterium]MBT3837413.1 (Fe-S)-binding protein [Thiotrichales bacterium]MBT4152698.1 (Fe-S)-binding protein [Thiotrichales bacterium]